MTPILISGIITGVEQIIGAIADAHKNGELTDADLVTATASTNASTRALIAAEIVARGGTSPI